MKAPRAILDELAGGDRRSIGRSNHVVQQVNRTSSLFPALMDGLFHADPLVCMRAADAVEKLTVAHPDWLTPFKSKLIGLAAHAEQQELRWHLAQLLPRLELTGKERKKVAGLLRGYLSDRSRIVRTFAMQALADLADRDARLRASVRRVVRAFVRTGSPAMKSRGRKLLLQLDRPISSHSAPVSSCGRPGK